jgi:hypothetical protein
MATLPVYPGSTPTTELNPGFGPPSFPIDQPIYDSNAPGYQSASAQYTATASTRGHVFVVLLAYLLELELDKAWHKLDVTVAEGIDELGSIRGTEMELAQVVYQTVPKATGLSLQLLEALSIKLPEALPLGKVHVATRKNLVSGRN